MARCNKGAAVSHLTTLYYLNIKLSGAFYVESRCLKIILSMFAHLEVKRNHGAQFSFGRLI